ncbi:MULTISPECIES: hypothetical protein [Staphylococcus]|uniref:hypothetical protein n=1 Tax=Staphylococcus TaxID=1279 RepID=UPI00069F83CA|nr:MULTISPECIES: hypothetical protein [Staphylococcus]MCI2863467.1 hypothetical protein [Staphylococcus hominis]MCI2867813.1 hypothetical protein [Staphylococcus hominis]MCI2885245.1 hypothetical protein [Staphylococcus hominis]NUI79384.1 hypothetical protein [Staphylococcus borealis]
MKKIIHILLIAILSIIFIGLILFAVNFARDMWSDNDTKTTNKSHQDTSKNNSSINSSKLNQDNDPNLITNNENQSVEANNTQQQTSSNEQDITTNDKTTNINNNYNENTHERPTDELGQTGGAPTPDNMKITLSELRETLKDVYDNPEELDKKMQEAKKSGSYIDDGSED